MSETKQGAFSEWYNQPKIQSAIHVVFSLGAAVVIVGALFKILHWPYASHILSVGMFTEAFLFALSSLERPFKTYEWDRIFDFKHSKSISQLPSHMSGAIGEHGRLAGLNYSQAIGDEEVTKLTDGIKNLSATAKQLTAISQTVKNTDTFAQTVEEVSKAATDYVSMQSKLNTATQKLFSGYENVGKEVDNLGMQMNNIGASARLYQDRVEGINKNLSSINSVYEIHLKNAQTQTEALNSQTDRVNAVSKEMEAILANIQKSNAASEAIAKDTEKYRQATALMAKQVADLNNVYGNMLNALN
ncbi:MAG: gliding motility protein GldL [Prevotellaceae bacterium]|jgi:gliding motility-associated protein GldL|nr:gliding motility protein GldL [Prevotellaceae bacterium]